VVVVVGSVLTAAPGTWSQPGATFAYRWRADGVAIAGATAATYTPTTPDVGKLVAVKVTASKPGFANGSRVSGAVGPVTAPTTTTNPPTTPGPTAPAAFVMSGKPKVAGTAAVGRKLKVKQATVTPAATQVVYQWLRNGKAIKKATKSSYKLTAADLGKKISLRITYIRPGYTSLVVSTKAVKVKPR